MSSVIETLDRRSFLGRSLWGLGASALNHLMPEYLLADQTQPSGLKARAKRVIYLFMSGAPSQLDLYDHKPGMEKWFDRDLPDSVRKGQRTVPLSYCSNQICIQAPRASRGRTFRAFASYLSGGGSLGHCTKRSYRCHQS
jgi:hypothetical protein